MTKKTDTQTPVTPSYISALLQPIPGRGTDRRVWSIPLMGVWVPFFTATNATGETAMPAEVLGAPLRLARDKDGSIRFSPSGRPVLKVERELSEQIRMVRDNFTAGLLAYADTIRKGMPNEYKAVVEASARAGEPIMARDMADLADLAPAPTPEAQAQKPAPERELVPA